VPFLVGLGLENLVVRQQEDQQKDRNRQEREEVLQQGQELDPERGFKQAQDHSNNQQDQLKSHQHSHQQDHKLCHQHDHQLGQDELDHKQGHQQGQDHQQVHGQGHQFPLIMTDLLDLPVLVKL